MKALLTLKPRTEFTVRNHCSQSLRQNKSKVNTQVTINKSSERKTCREEKKKKKKKKPYCHRLHIYTEYIYLGHFPPFWGVANNTKKTTKTMGVLLRSFSNDEWPGRVWMALLEQHRPSSPSSTTYVASQMPSPLLPLPQGCLYKATPWQQQMPIRTASQAFGTLFYS